MVHGNKGMRAPAGGRPAESRGRAGDGRARALSLRWWEVEGEECECHAGEEALRGDWEASCSRPKALTPPYSPDP